MKLFIILVAALSLSLITAINTEENAEFLRSWLIESNACFNSTPMSDDIFEKAFTFPDEWTRDVKCWMRCLVVGTGLLDSDEVKYASPVRQFLKEQIKNEPTASSKAAGKSVLNCFDASIAEEECERAGQFFTCLIQLPSFLKEIIITAFDLFHNEEFEKLIPGGTEKLANILKNPDFKNITLEYEEMQKEKSY